MHNLDYTREEFEIRLKEGYYRDIVAIGVKMGLWTESDPPSKDDIDLGLFVAATKKEKSFTELLKSHIDNDTIYFDEEHNVIKAKIPEPAPDPEISFTISVGINPGNENQCTVVAEGEVLDSTVASDKSKYMFRVKKGADLKVIIKPNDFYTVSQLNVDKVSQGEASSYSFKNIEEDHTMYVWIKEETVSSVEFLERSDKPGVLYSGIGKALESLKGDYPSGLDKDVTIKCIKRASEIRSSIDNSNYGIWVSKFYDFNKDSIYTITIDGQDHLTIDCRWLGGLYFEDVDNVLIRGVKFVNYCNHAGQASPDELSAIFINSKNSLLRNYVLHNNVFVGNFLYNGKYYGSWYCLTLKNIGNIIIDKNDFQRGGALMISATGCEAVELTRNNMNGIQPINTTLAHPMLFNLTSNNGTVKIEDNVIDGEGFSEYTCQVNGFSKIQMNRNIVKNCSGQPISFNKNIDQLDIIDNVFFNNITGAKFIYLRHIMGGDFSVGQFNMGNNTIYLNGEYSSAQDVVNCYNIDKLYNYNNIIINKLGKASAVFAVNGIKKYYSGNNIYSSAFYNNDPTKRFMRLRVVEAVDNDESKGYINFKFETRLISEMQNKGFEIGSWAISPESHVLDIEDNVNSYKLIDVLKDRYLSNMKYVPEFDVEYLKVGGKCTVGAYNLFGSKWDETLDDSSGYHGFDVMYPSNVFDDSGLYVSPAEDNILIFVYNKDRTCLIKNLFKPEVGDSILRYGSVVSASLMCVYDKNTGMYIRDNNYDLKIEKIAYGE